MESLLIGALQGLANYAGLSFLDRMNIKKYQKKMEQGTAKMRECAKVVTYLHSQKQASDQIEYYCEQMLKFNKQTLFANVNLGVIAVADLIEANYDKKILLNSGKFIKAKIYLERAIEISNNKAIVEYEWEDLATQGMLYSLMNYYYGYILYLQGRNDLSKHHKELGQKQVPGMGGLPY